MAMTSLYVFGLLSFFFFHLFISVKSYGEIVTFFKLLTILSFYTLNCFSSSFFVGLNACKEMCFC